MYLIVYIYVKIASQIIIFVHILFERSHAPVCLLCARRFEFIRFMSENKAVCSLKSIPNMLLYWLLFVCTCVCMCSHAPVLDDVVNYGVQRL